MSNGRSIPAGYALAANGEYYKLNPATKPPELKPIPAKRIRQSSKPLSNKLETEFGQYLQANYPNSSTKFYEQAITLRLGNGLKYTPDWVVCISLRTYCFEVKGKHVWDDSIAKLKMAASVYPKWTWYLAWKQDGQWKMQEVLP